MPTIEDRQIIETATEARQGERGPTVRTVLLISTGSLIVLFAGIYAYYFA